MASRTILAAAGMIAAVALGATSGAAVQGATRVTVASDGSQGNGPSYFGTASANGRFVVFSSDATNLVADDTNGHTDVFRRDLKTGQTIRISVDDAGVQGNSRSFASGVSRDGRLVLFWSHATNLVAGDQNGQPDVFLHDVALRTTTRLSLGPDGVEPDGGSRFPSMSANGRWVAFQSNASNLVHGDGNDVEDVFLLDRRTGATTRVGQPRDGESDGHSLGPALSANGRHLAFESSATNLVPGDTNGLIDAFVLDLRRGTLALASVSDEGVQGNQQSRSPRVTNNGRWVLFSSLAGNLVPGDTNQAFDSFVRDLRRGRTHRVSVASDGSEGNHGSARGTLDPRGRYVAFGSTASNLVSGDTNAAADVFVRDLVRGTTVRVTASHDGGETDGDSHAIAFLGGAKLLVTSLASNLVPGDDNGADDSFVLRWR